MKLRQNSVNQILNPHAIFFFLLTGATWCYYASYILCFIYWLWRWYFGSFFYLFLNLHVQWSKLGQKIEKFGRKSFFFNWSLQSSWRFFSKSALNLWTNADGITTAMEIRKKYYGGIQICMCVFFYGPTNFQSIGPLGRCFL